LVKYAASDPDSSIDPVNMVHPLLLSFDKGLINLGDVEDENVIESSFAYGGKGNIS
jgi:hypothetical protein